ncbi:MAG: lipopolysaccharide heptosyltransferase II [Candidatus Omnitrophica bacterium]|nr:lipopolysaccharide heptosyltransferase II [Candidatus Omnitrophota bacterium]MDD5351836.1 lipopolysaccharide heptosyltransferase II [Candidatus Omnitrophota bacterium]MDD5550662.1 lipopolysaccharide heptosyltransferase II [Candidatus Omnitrophota bacterium]
MTDPNHRRILIVEVNWIGDVLFSTAAIRALKNKYPQSYIGVLLHKRCSEILAGNPYINEIIILDEKNEHRGLFGKLRLIRQLKSRQFDAVYLFHRSFTRALICFLSGIKNRIGYYTTKRRFLLTENVHAPKEVIHRAVYYYYLVARSIPSDPRFLRCDFSVADQDITYVSSLLQKENTKDKTRLVVIHPVGNWLPKRWPKENFAKLADVLVDKFGVGIIFSGASQEQNIINDILRLMKNKAINLCGKTTIKQLGALFIKADLVVSADSGPLHLAVALNRPVVALFGPTSKDITGPLTQQNIVLLQKEINCIIPCYKENCSDNRCMKQISVKDVINAIEEKKWLANVKGKK